MRATASRFGAAGRLRRTMWSAKRSLGLAVASTPSAAKSSRSSVPTLRPPSGFSVNELMSTSGTRASSIARVLSESQAVAASACDSI